MDSLMQRIEKLQALRDANVINDTEFNAKRQALVDQFVGLQQGGRAGVATATPRRPAPMSLSPRRSAFAAYAGPGMMGMGMGMGMGFGQPMMRPGAFLPRPVSRPKPYDRSPSGGGAGAGLRKQLLAERGTAIKVQPIPEGIDEAQLIDAFSVYGEVASAAVHGGTPAYAHVNFATQDEAHGVALMQKMDWGGVICRVTLSRRRWEAVIEGPPSNGIGIFHLPLTMTQDELEAMLAPYPGLIGVKMVHHGVTPDGRGGEFRGYAFAYYDTVDNATLAKSQLLGTVVEGRPLDVKYSNKPMQDVLGTV